MNAQSYPGIYREPVKILVNREGIKARLSLVKAVREGTKHIEVLGLGLIVLKIKLSILPVKFDINVARFYGIRRINSVIAVAIGQVKVITVIIFLLDKNIDFNLLEFL